ncbi:hypothetical protein [Clostridium sp. C8-1-8]|uniref:hypothetical protein n=1 Tax=Clostridium sp. C8-1-8 TaxID=2698831 RepID=UPI00136AF482|nr:hypothetical protein [Clostridium sp. C8-1-8]
MTKVAIRQVNGMLEVSNFGMCVIRDTRETIMDVLQEQILEETDLYTKKLIGEILILLKRLDY